MPVFFKKRKIQLLTLKANILAPKAESLVKFHQTPQSCKTLSDLEKVLVHLMSFHPSLVRRCLLCYKSWHSNKMSARARRISRFRGAISDSSVGEVCRRTNKTSFYTFCDWYWCDPTGKMFNGLCSYGNVWRVSRIILDIIQLKLI